MAYYYTSNHTESLDNYKYYDQYYYNNHNYSNQEPRYVQYSDSEFYDNAYQHALTPSLVGYYYSCYNQPESLTSKNGKFCESGEYYDPVVSTEYVVYYDNSTTAEAEVVTEVVSEESDPHPNPNLKTFLGGYDIHEKYGKPLPPSEEICYPTSKPDPNNVKPLDDFSYGSVPSPYVKEVKNDVVSEEAKQANGITGSKVIQEENPSTFEEDEYGEEDDEEAGGEKQDEFVDGARTCTEVPKQTNDQIVASKGIQEEDPSDFEEEEDLDVDEEEEEEVGGEKQDELSEEPSKTNQIVPISDANSAKEDQNIEDEAKPKDGSIVGGVIQQQKALDFEEEKEEEEGDLGEQGTKVEDYGNQVRRQIPPGYGMEALDLCEGVFGGYFPCLWKRNQRIYNGQRDSNENTSDYDYCMNKTADYLFGNPNPYGGTMPEKGSYGDPVLSYHRHYPQQPLSEHLEYHGSNSLRLHNSKYYDGNYGYYHQ